MGPDGVTQQAWTGLDLGREVGLARATRERLVGSLESVGAVAAVSGGARKAAHYRVYLAGRGLKVAIIDFDRQGSQSALFDLLDESLRGDEVLYQVLKRRVDVLAALTAIHPDTLPHFDDCPPGELYVVQGGPQTEIAIDDIASNPVRYKMPSTLEILSGVVARLEGTADVVLIDMGPSDQVMAVAGLMAADAVLIPTTVDYLSVVRVAAVLEEIDVVRAQKPDLAILGIVPTMTKYYFGGLRPAKNVQIGKQMLDDAYGPLLLKDRRGKLVDVPEHDDWKNAQWAGRSVLTLEVSHAVRDAALRFVRTTAVQLGLAESEVQHG